MTSRRVPITWVMWQDDQATYYQTMNGRGFTRVEREVVESDGRHVYREDEVMNMDWDSESSLSSSSKNEEGYISGDAAMDDAAAAVAANDDSGSMSSMSVDEDEWTSYGREEEQERMRDICDVCSYHEDEDDREKDDGEKEKKKEKEKEAGAEAEREICIICTEPINPKKNCAITDCGHSFCLTCLLRNMYYSISCPLCRTYLINPDTVVSHEDDDYNEQRWEGEEGQRDVAGLREEGEVREGEVRGAGEEGEVREGEVRGPGEEGGAREEEGDEVVMDVTPDVTIVYNLVVNAQNDVTERNSIFRIAVDELADVKREIVSLLIQSEGINQMITNTYFQIVTSEDEIAMIREVERERQALKELEIKLLEDVVCQYSVQLSNIYKQIHTLRNVEKERMASWISCHNALKEAKDAEENTVKLYNSVVTRLFGGIDGAVNLVEPIPVYIWQELPHSTLHPVEL